MVRRQPRLVGAAAGRAPVVEDTAWQRRRADARPHHRRRRPARARARRRLRRPTTSSPSTTRALDVADRDAVLQADRRGRARRGRARRGVDRRRRLRERSRPGLRGSTRSAPATCRGGPPGRRARRATSRPTTSSTATPAAPYTEWDDTEPAVGLRPLEARRGARARSGLDTIVRTSWVCGRHGAQLRARRCCAWPPSATSCAFVDDQRGCPTFTRRPGRDDPPPGRGPAARACSTSPTRARRPGIEFARDDPRGRRAATRQGAADRHRRARPAAPAPRPGQLGARQRRPAPAGCAAAARLPRAPRAPGQGADRHEP